MPTARQPTMGHMLLLQDMFIFKVEGTGALPPQDIVTMALDVLMAKFTNLQHSLASSKEEFGGLEA